MRTPRSTEQRLRDCIEGLCYQFAYTTDDGKLWTGGLSALEEAFDLLDWDDPFQLPKEELCDEPGCSKRTTDGTPTTDGYRRTCSQHAPPWPPKEGA